MRIASARSQSTYPSWVPGKSASHSPLAARLALGLDPNARLPVGRHGATLAVSIRPAIDRVANHSVDRSITGPAPHGLTAVTLRGQIESVFEKPQQRLAGGRCPVPPPCRRPAQSPPAPGGPGLSPSDRRSSRNRPARQRSTRRVWLSRNVRPASAAAASRARTRSASPGGFAAEEPLFALLNPRQLRSAASSGPEALPIPVHHPRALPSPGLENGRHRYARGNHILGGADARAVP